MADRPEMPIPSGEMTPAALASLIKEWAESQGFHFEKRKAATEYGLVKVSDPSDGETWTVIPNAHKGRRLKKHQIRYTIHKLNSNWKD